MSVRVLDRFELVAPFDEDGVLRRWVARNLEPRDGEPVLVAVAGLPAGVALSERIRQLATYEADLAMQLNHPKISRMFDAGIDGERLFFVTDLPRGESWMAIWNKALMFGDRIPVSMVICLVIDVLDALHHAHTQLGDSGITLHAIHGAIAPNRLVLSPRGEVVVGDFGVGKVLQKVNEFTEGLGSEYSMAYRAPEQVQTKAIGTSTDVFLVGVVLWEMLAMRRLYPEEVDRRDIAIVTTKAVPPSDHNAAVTHTLDQIVATALAKQPSQRYADAGEFAAALRPFESSMPMHGTVESYLDEQFVESTFQWRELEFALAEDDLHGALLAARGTLLQATI